LDQQHTCRLSQCLPRLLHMRTDQFFVTHIRLLQEAVGGVHLPLAVQLARQGGRWLVGHGLGYLHRSLGAALVTQMRRPKRLLGPLGGPTTTSSHSSLLFSSCSALPLSSSHPITP